MTDGDFHADLVGEVLQLALPQPQARAVAATPVSGDEQSFGLGIANAADLLPPATDGLYRKGCRVVVDADAAPPGVGCEIIDTIRHRPPQLLDQEVVDPHLFRLTFRPPLPTAILEVADQLFLLGVDGNNRLLLFERSLDPPVDVAKLGIPIRVAVTFSGLAVSLQAKVQRLQQLANHRMTDPMPLRAKFGCEPTQALAGPTQGRLRVAALGRLDQSQQRLHQLLITLHQRLASTPSAANLPLCRFHLLGKLFQSAIDRARRHPGRPPHRGDPPYPAPSASAAANTRRLRSSRCRDRAANRSRIGL